ncbi:MAG: hypothetical protein HY259_12810 [Chloroflexi bacterium]|nr:hypothetical protein [Chloroflexota bacterium]
MNWKERMNDALAEEQDRIKREQIGATKILKGYQVEEKLTGIRDELWKAGDIDFEVHDWASQFESNPNWAGTSLQTLRQRLRSSQGGAVIALLHVNGSDYSHKRRNFGFASATLHVSWFQYSPGYTGDHGTYSDGSSNTFRIPSRGYQVIRSISIVAICRIDSLSALAVASDLHRDYYNEP